MRELEDDESQLEERLKEFRKQIQGLKRNRVLFKVIFFPLGIPFGMFFVMYVFFFPGGTFPKAPAAACRIPCTKV